MILGSQKIISATVLITAIIGVVAGAGLVYTLRPSVIETVYITETIWSATTIIRTGVIWKTFMKTSATTGPIYTPIGWQKVFTFSGTGIKDSDQFHIATNQFRVSFTVVSSTPLYSSFLIYVAPLGAPYYDYVGQASHNEPGTDTIYVKAGPGDFYLSVLSTNNEWMVAVEQPF